MRRSSCGRNQRYFVIEEEGLLCALKHWIRTFSLEHLECQGFLLNYSLTKRASQSAATIKLE